VADARGLLLGAVDAHRERNRRVDLRVAGELADRQPRPVAWATAAPLCRLRSGSPLSRNRCWPVAAYSRSELETMRAWLSARWIIAPTPLRSRRSAVESPRLEARAGAVVLGGEPSNGVTTLSSRS
jgi:hypothetical protein